MSDKQRGWVRWNGGERPVNKTVLVNVRLELPDGRLQEREDTAGWFESLGWWSGLRPVRIISYQKSNREGLTK